MPDTATPSAADTVRQNRSDRQAVLVLQGGGALGSYQAGAFAALAAGGQSPDWVAGVSIGAINGAIIAGNAAVHRVDRLLAFWDTITAPTALWPDPAVPAWRTAARHASAAAAVLFGQPGFFRPRMPAEWFSRPAPLSYYDTSALRGTLERLVDFDRINHPASPRLSIGAVNVETGNLTYFDNRTQRIEPQHVMASGALPPGLSTVEIDGQYYWDGGLVSNTPLQYVLDTRPRQHLLVFQIDLFPARGKLPENLDEVVEREKDIRYSSRTRSGTDNARRRQEMRNRVHEFLAQLPPELRDNPVARQLGEMACPMTVDIVHLIYRPSVPQGAAKDYEFSRASMRRRWDQGRDDALATVSAAPWDKEPAEQGVRVFDVLGALRR